MTGGTPPKLHPLGLCEPALQDWLQTQAALAYDAFRADPSRGPSLEAVRASIGKR